MWGGREGRRGGEEVRYVRGVNWSLNSGGVNRQVTQVSSAAISSLLSPLLFGFLHPRVERRRGIQRYHCHPSLPPSLPSIFLSSHPLPFLLLLS